MVAAKPDPELSTGEEIYGEKEDETEGGTSDRVGRQDESTG
jgi:hypothetical protein